MKRAARAQHLSFTGKQVRRMPSVSACVATRAVIGWLRTLLSRTTAALYTLPCTKMCHVGISIRKNCKHLETFCKFSAQGCPAGAGGARRVHFTCAPRALAAQFEPWSAIFVHSSLHLHTGGIKYTARTVHTVSELTGAHCTSINCQRARRYVMHFWCTLSVHSVVHGARAVYTLSSITGAL